MRGPGPSGEGAGGAEEGPQEEKESGPQAAPRQVGGTPARPGYRPHIAERVAGGSEAVQHVGPARGSPEEVGACGQRHLAF